MRQALKEDKRLVVSIITETFKDNSGVNWMFSDRNRAKKLKRLADYAFIKSYNRNGVFISSNNKGVALCYLKSKAKYSLLEFYYELRFGLLSLPLSRMTEVLQRESFRKNKRTKDGEYYYFWFLGVLEDGQNAGIELNRELINKAKEENTPIYLETAMLRNKEIYERVGYETYDHWKEESKGIEFWFMRYVP